MSITLDGTNGITTPDVETSDGAVYAKGNILGTVSQASGVPTGAIIESGSNANGEYVKYADGTMMTRTRATLTGTSSSRLQDNVTLPVEFASISDMHPQLTLPSHSASAFIGVSRTDVESWGCAQPGGSGQFTTEVIGCSVFCASGSVGTSPPATIDDVYLTVTGRWF